MLRTVRRHPLVASLFGVAALLALYYLSIPVFGAHYAEVCSKGEYGPPEQCSDYDVVSALVGRFFVFADAHNGIITALAGIAVAAFTGVLWRATERLWKAGEKQIALARDAADLAERAFSEADRPYLVMRIVDHRIGVPDREPVVNFTVRNIGKSPALIHELDVRLIGKHGTTGTETVIGTKVMSHRQILQAGDDDFIFERATGERLTAPVAAEIVSGQIVVSFIGKIGYQSPQGAAWIHQALAVYQKPGFSIGDRSGFGRMMWSDLRDRRFAVVGEAKA